MKIAILRPQAGVIQVVDMQHRRTSYSYNNVEKFPFESASIEYNTATAHQRQAVYIASGPEYVPTVLNIVFNTAAGPQLFVICMLESTVRRTQPKLPVIAPSQHVILANCLVNEITKPYLEKFVSSPDRTFIVRNTQAPQAAISLREVTASLAGVKINESKALSMHVAKIVARDAIRQNEPCSISLESLTVPIYVAQCGHAFSELAKNLTTCPTCRLPSHWTVVTNL